MKSILYFVMLVSLLAASGCGGTSVGSLSEPATPAIFNASNSPTVSFSVPDMMCADGCGAAVEATLAKQSGALDVQVDFDTKTATVAVDEDKFDADKAVAALVDKMFPNSKLKSAESVGPQSTSEAVVH
jgi:copper chaperone CopZ